MAAVVSTSSERLEFPPQQRPMDRSPSKSSATDSSASLTADVSESNFLSFHSNSNKDFEIQSPLASRSEEYRQLFRLPSHEVLVEDFNCAFQENILIQGHMYLFVRYVCFYSNIFGFETKKIIPFQEVTTVRKAKTAGIFPNAIEILAGSKKYFFASFLSRDEAFKLINDGWLQHDNNANEFADSQEISADSSICQDNNIEVEEVESPKILADEVDSAERNTELPIMQESVDPSNFESNNISTPAKTPVNAELVKEPIIGPTHASSSTDTWTWKEENSDAPNVPDCFTKVAESKFPIRVKDFFSLFFSDDAVDFIASFHEQCGDKDFKCSSWSADAKVGHARDASFQHPIKIYFGAKCGSCHETQKLRLYKNSYMIIETSQDISDVPYSDYFSVEARWDVIKDTNKSNEGCSLRVYVNVAFSKKTLFKGKIVQSTIEECREAYATWINMAHELLTLKNLEKQNEERPSNIIVENGSDQVKEEERPSNIIVENGSDQVKEEERPSNIIVENGSDQVKEVKTGESSGRSYESSDLVRLAQTSRSIEANKEAGNLLQENDTNSLTALLREPMAKFSSIFKSPNHLPYLLIIIFVVIFLMQLSIVMLLARPQHIHVSSPDQMNNMGSDGARTPEAMAWLEKRLHHLKDEMYMVEARLERMRHEHAQLSAQLKGLETPSARR